MLVAADLNLLKVPSDLSDNKALFLSDILATAWFAVDLAKVADGDTVAIWGAGPGESYGSMPYWESLCASVFFVCLFNFSVLDATYPSKLQST